MPYVYQLTFDINAEESGLDAFPFPSFLFFAVVEFDFLHAHDQLDHVALVFGQLGEAFEIEFASFFEEQVDPEEVQEAAEGKDQKYSHIVDGQDKAEDDQVEHGEEDIEGGSGQKVFDSGMVADALHDIADHFGIEEADG